MLRQTWIAEVDHATPTEWSAELDHFRDANIYQTWSYGRIRWGEQNLSHLALRCNGEVVALAQLRIVRPTRLSFGMAYLRWGPLWERRQSQLDPEIVTYMARALEQEYVVKRRLFLQVLPNAFAGSARAAAIQSAFSSFGSVGHSCSNPYRTLLLDLSTPLDNMRKQFDPKWRNKLSGAERKGLKVTVGTGPEQYRKFCQMYVQMQSRKRFDSNIEIEEFGRIQSDLPEPHRMRVLICERDGTSVAGVVASALGDSAIYLLGATSDDGLDSKGAYLLQWELIKWLKENGYRWYDLGGINPERNPGVYQFKSGLRGTDVFFMNSLFACSSFISFIAARTALASRDVVAKIRQLRYAQAIQDSRTGA